MILAVSWEKGKQIELHDANFWNIWVTHLLKPRAPELRRLMREAPLQGIAIRMGGAPNQQGVISNRVSSKHSTKGLHAIPSICGTRSSASLPFKFGLKR